MDQVDSLTRSCLKYVGEKAAWYKLHVFQDLPITLVQSLLPYLSASQLHRLDDLFKQAGICTKATWEAHLSRRWSQWSHRPPQVFQEAEDDPKEDPHQKYLQNHFHDLLFATFDHLRDKSFGPQDHFEICLHRMKSYREAPEETEKPPVPEGKQNDDIYIYAAYARRLTLMGASCEFVLRDCRLIEVLQTCVEQLNIHLLHDRHYPFFRQLLLAFLEHGILKHLMMFHNKLQSFERDLLEICAGLYDPETIAKAIPIPPARSTAPKKSSEKKSGESGSKGSTVDDKKCAPKGNDTSEEHKSEEDSVKLTDISGTSKEQKDSEDPKSQEKSLKLTGDSATCKQTDKSDLLKSQEDAIESKRYTLKENEQCEERTNSDDDTANDSYRKSVLNQSRNVDKAESPQTGDETKASLKDTNDCRKGSDLLKPESGDKSDDTAQTCDPNKCCDMETDGAAVSLRPSSSQIMRLEGTLESVKRRESAAGMETKETQIEEGSCERNDVNKVFEVSEAAKTISRCQTDTLTCTVSKKDIELGENDDICAETDVDSTADTVNQEVLEEENENGSEKEGLETIGMEVDSTDEALTGSDRLGQSGNTPREKDAPNRCFTAETIDIDENTTPITNIQPQEAEEVICCEETEQQSGDQGPCRKDNDVLDSQNEQSCVNVSTVSDTEMPNEDKSAAWQTHESFKDVKPGDASKGKTPQDKGRACGKRKHDDSDDEDQGLQTAAKAVAIDSIDSGVPTGRHSPAIRSQVSDVLVCDTSDNRMDEKMIRTVGAPKSACDTSGADKSQSPSCVVAASHVNDPSDCDSSVTGISVSSVYGSAVAGSSKMSDCDSVQNSSGSFGTVVSGEPGTGNKMSLDSANAQPGTSANSDTLICEDSSKVNIPIHQNQQALDHLRTEISTELSDMIDRAIAKMTEAKNKANKRSERKAAKAALKAKAKKEAEDAVEPPNDEGAQATTSSAGANVSTSTSESEEIETEEETSPTEVDLYDMALLLHNQLTRTRPKRRTRSDSSSSSSSLSSEGTSATHKRLFPSRFEIKHDPAPLENLSKHSIYLKNRVPQKSKRQSPQTGVVKENEKESKEPTQEEQALKTAQPRERGLETLALVSVHGSELSRYLSEFLPNWTKLKKLALVHVYLHPNTKLEEAILKRIHAGEMTQLVVEGSWLCSNLLAFIQNATSSKTNKKLWALELKHVTRTHHKRGTVPRAGPYKSNLTHLDLGNNRFNHAAVDLLAHMLKDCFTLKFLGLEHCNLKESWACKILTALHKAPKLEVLILNQNSLTGDAADIVLSILQTVTTLKTIKLVSCQLPLELVDSKEFVYAVIDHPALKEIKLAGNRLSWAGCRFLERYCKLCGPNPTLQCLDLGEVKYFSKYHNTLIVHYHKGESHFRVNHPERITDIDQKFQLDAEISFNLMEGSDLELVAGAISKWKVKPKPPERYQKKQRKIVLTGNLLGQHRQIIVTAFREYFPEVYADLFDYTVPFAEHAAQV